MKYLSTSQRKLNTSFRKLGVLIGKHPKWTIAFSVISSLICALGALRFTYSTDFDYLMTPVGCRAYDEEKTLRNLFPINTSSNFDIYRAISRGRFGSVIILSKDGGNVLRGTVFSEVLRLDNEVRSFAVESNGEIYNYTKTCAKNRDTCWTNEIMNFRDDIQQIESKTTFIKYPFHLDFATITLNVSAINLGGVKTNEDSNVLEAKAVRLLYFLDNSGPEMEILALKWEKKFLDVTRKYQSNLVTVYRFVSQSFENEVWTFVIESLTLGWVSIFVILLFSVISSMTTNWVRSKPWLAISGCISVVLAIIASFGILMAFGVACVPINVAIPFMILGIGIDDTFVLISAWRRTSTEDSIVERMGEAYSNAAMSIIMTSVTNVISFLAGMIAPFPALKVFCAYAAMAVVFDLVYQITFFGACMALDGEREQRHLHPFTFRPIETMEEKSDRGRFYQILFTDKSDKHQSKPPRLMIWYRDSLGHWIGQTRVKIGILAVLFIYLAGAGWSITALREGIDYKDIFPYNSFASSYILKYYDYFTEYPHQVQVVINTTMDYSDPSVQKKVLETLQRFKKSPYIVDLQMNWLEYYLKFLENEKFWVYRKLYNINSTNGFIRCFREVFLRHPMTKMFEQDVIFNEDETRVVASRFVIFTKNIHSSIDEKEMVINLRSIADSSPLPVTVQNMMWINLEQHIVIIPVALQSIAAAVLSTLFVFFLFLPSFSSVVCVTLTIISIEFGAIGYMAAFDITLNSISAIILVMSVGFCVDYSAHISYSYTAARGSHRDRIKHSLFAAAMPVTQATCSSMLGLVTLLLVPSFMLLTFSKVVILIIAFAFLHAIFVLPTILSIWDIIIERWTQENIKDEQSNTIHALMT